jgi:hypothetical protein
VRTLQRSVGEFNESHKTAEKIVSTLVVSYMHISSRLLTLSSNLVPSRLRCRRRRRGSSPLRHSQ